MCNRCPIEIRLELKITLPLVGLGLGYFAGLWGAITFVGLALVLTGWLQTNAITSERMSPKLANVLTDLLGLGLGGFLVGALVRGAMWAVQHFRYVP